MQTPYLVDLVPGQWVLLPGSGDRDAGELEALIDDDSDRPYRITVYRGDWSIWNLAPAVRMRPLLWLRFARYPQLGRWPVMPTQLPS